MPQSSQRGPDLSFSVAEPSVRQMIAQGKHKTALDRAKDLHKANASAASEALLLDAYMSRIQALIQQNLIVEATSLMDLLRDRYPSSASRLAGRATSAAARSGKLDDLLRPLNDPSLAPEQRAAIEQAIEQNVHDLAALAGCAALPLDHPLRLAAAALQRAFDAVTTGPVVDLRDEAALALPEVSRRSPLASWKMLIGAIASFYRRDDEACRRYLAAIQPGSAPSRCIPALEAMLDDKSPDDKSPAALKGPASVLVPQVTGNASALKHAVEELDSAFKQDDHKRIFQAIRAAVEECRRTAPKQTERFRQHISARCALLEFPRDRTTAALGGPTREDAYFQRLFAVGTEQTDDIYEVALACGAWDRFRQAAVEEGWFPPNGPEAAALYLHIAKLLDKIPADALPKLRQVTKKQLPDEDLFYLDPDSLYQRACALDPHFEAFQQWLTWAKRESTIAADPIAEMWHKHRPRDLEPVLHLMESFESRNAFPTALQYLDKAENIDGVKTEVRRARLRLMAGSAIRYLQQKKPDLAAKRIEEIAALPQAQQGDRLAYLAALRYATVDARGDTFAANAIRAELERMLESPAGAAMLIFAVATLCKFYYAAPDIHKLPKEDRERLPATFARLVALSRDMQFTVPMLYDWMREITKQFGKSKKPFSAPQLRDIGRGALSNGFDDLAYTVSTKGLEAGGDTSAEFLFLRARALPNNQWERRMLCAAAAAELARRQGDTELAGKAVEMLSGPFKDGSIELTPEQVADVVRQEKTKPKPNDSPPRYGSLVDSNRCNCPECRRARGEALPYDEGDFGEEEDDPFDDMGGLEGLDMPADMPPEIAAFLMQETKQAILTGESLEDLLARLMGMGFPPPTNRRPKPRRKGTRR